MPRWPPLPARLRNFRRPSRSKTISTLRRRRGPCPKVSFHLDSAGTGALPSPSVSQGDFMSAHDYSRNLVGYGCNTPDPKWPGGAHVAVQFVINYEEGGESCILDGDPASECLLSEIVGAQPWSGQRNLNMESIYEYGSRAGFWRLWRLFTELKVQATVYGVTLAMARNPEAVAAMKEAGWEIASHGY